MAKTITLSIDEPCSEDWNKMTPQGLGRHCDSCEKVVVDFSNKSDLYIAKYFKKHNNVCGRFRPEQLNRPIDLSVRRNSLFPPLAASFILPLAMLTASPAYSQQDQNFKRNTEYVSLNIGSQKSLDYKDIKGVVKDTSGNPLAGVRIRVNESKDQIQTDSSGTYRLRVRNGDKLSLSYYLFLEEEAQIGENQDVYDFVMEKDPNYLPEVVVIAPSWERQTMVMGGPSKYVSVTTTTILNIKSKVVTENGWPLSNVKIQVKGTAAVLTSGFEGEFEIDLKPEDVLIFTLENYKTLEIKVEDLKAEVIMKSSIDPAYILGGVAGGVRVISSESSVTELKPKPQYTSVDQILRQ